MFAVYLLKICWIGLQEIFAELYASGREAIQNMKGTATVCDVQEVLESSPRMTSLPMMLSMTVGHPGLRVCLVLMVFRIKSCCRTLS